MAAFSLYEKKILFKNRRRKSPVNFPVEQYNLSAMRALLERAAPVLNRSRIVCSRNVTGIAVGEWSKGCDKRS